MTTTSITITTSTMTATLTMSQFSPTTSSLPESSDKLAFIAEVVGIVGGGVCILVIPALAIWCICFRQQRQPRQQNNQPRENNISNTTNSLTEIPMAQQNDQF